jgi:ABC-type lipoprotein export system ATPase subunit
VLLRGASGTGKSSLLHLIAGLMAPTKGSVFVGDQNLAELSDSNRASFRRKSVGLIFQKLNLISHLTVAENVSLAGGDADAVATALKSVGLSEMTNVKAALLSGGEQQRVAVARVLAQAPDVILADEPTSSLDDVNAQFVIEALKKAAKGKSLLVVSHDDRLQDQFKDVRLMETL